MKLIKKFKLVSLMSLVVASVSVVAGTTSVLLVKQQKDIQKIDDVNNSDFNQNVSDNNSPIVNVDNNNVQKAKPLIPSGSNYFNAKLSSVNGPILFWNTKITSADWFGAKRWEIDLLNAKDDNGIKFSINPNGHDGWKRTWLNWDLDKKNDVLYVLSSWGRIGDPTTGTPQQNVVAIDVSTGKVIKVYELKDIGLKAFFAVSVLENGDVLVYAQQGNAVTKNIIINTKKQTYEMGQGDLESISKLPENENGSDYSSSKNYLMNLIPIGPNRNLAITYNLTGHSSSTEDNGKDKGTSQVEFMLCDDNMKKIPNAQGNWNKPVLVTKAIKNTINSMIWPQRDWYKLIDGRIVTVIYDKLVVINPNNLNNPDLKVFVLDKDQWVDSWSFDTNENLFYKNKDDTKIKKVIIPKNNDSPKISEYLDLINTSNQKIKDNARSFNLYNVFGYAGQIMLINTYFSPYVQPNSYPDDALSKNYGLAVAVTDNKNSAGYGDTKGLLNTEEAFQKSADFFIDKDILANKLPSEITRNDLSFTEKGFLTKNKTMINGELKYPPFVKTTIDDKNKKLKIEANVDQIPWFVGDNKMPDNIPPLKIVKEFQSDVEITSRYWWKDADDDYDFKNTLPSKLTLEDIKRINPFMVNINSQKVNIEKTDYPRLTYSTKDVNDSLGKITIVADYEYLPMDTPVTKSKLLKITSEKKFNIFKSNDNKVFKFVGNDSEQDINQINQLKELQEANVLPSSFENANKQEFLKFIDVEQTKGYPLSKMDIKVETNDSKGELTIMVDPKKYDPNLKTESKKFTGFNKTNEYNLSFENTKTSINKKHYLPSDISEEIFFDNFVKYTGFDSTDLHLELFPNNDKGILNASLYLLTNYPESTIKNNTPFKKDSSGKWVAKNEISNFKTTDEFNKDYQLIFKKDNDSSLMKIKESTPSEIVSAFKTSSQKKVTIGDQQYDDKHDFVKKEFVQSLGSKMPSLIASDKIKIDLFANNSGGELTVKIVFEDVPGYNIPLTFIQIFTGFAKGNDVVTNDVLVLKNQMQLENTLPTILKTYPSMVKQHLEKNVQDINQFFTTTPTGDYKKAIDSNKFELLISADDIHGELIVTIKFNREDITDKKSLLEYSQLYTNLKHY